MAQDLKNKVVIVTGANSGIGAATAALFLERGAKVAALDISDSTIASQPSRLDIKCDVSSEESVDAAMEQILEQWQTVDVLVNNAGVTDDFSRIGECTNATFEKCMKVNVNGPFYFMRAVIPHFLRKSTPRKGDIVNVCSYAAKGAGSAGAAYTASKHALLGLSRSTAWMYQKEGIRCNAVLPGGVQTNIVQNSKVQINPEGWSALQSVHKCMTATAQAVDVAQAIVFLVSAEMVNGAELTVDGGWSTG